MMRRFFIRRTVQYVCWFLIPIICAFLFLGTLIVRQQSASLAQEGENSLDALYSQLDLVVNSVLEEQNQVANSTNMMVALKKILSSEDYISYSDSIYIRSITTFLSGIVQSHDYISSVYLYFDGYDAYFSSTSKKLSLSDEDDSWLSIYLDMEEGTEGLARLRTQTESTYSEDSATQVLSIYRRMLIQDGVIVLNLNLQKLQESLNSMSANVLEKLYLFDDTGALLTADEDEIVSDISSEDRKQQLLSLADTEENEKWQKLGDGYYLIQVQSYELYHLYLISVIPRISLIRNMLPLFGIFALFFLLDVGIAVSISYVTTKGNFREIEYTLHLFEQAEQGNFPEQEDQQPQDEYGVIMNNILRMFLNTTYLNTQLAEKQYRQQVMELSTLQYQINPHFLFNTLQTVELEIRKLPGDTENATEILTCLSDILKYSLGDPTATVTLAEELRYLKEYVSIQQYRLREEFIVYYEIEDEWMDFQVPRLLLQPLLENSILHGLRESGRKGYVKIRVYPRNNQMQFVVIDNGSGMTKEELARLRERICDENSRNIGLTNVNRRLILRYSEKSALKLQAKEGLGCCISFHIPLVQPDELYKNTNNDKK